MKKAEFIRRMAVGSKWHTEYLQPLRAANSIAPERTVTKHQSNGCWFTPTPWSERPGFLDWPKAANIVVEDDGAIVLTFDDGRPYVRYRQLKSIGEQ